jgi:ArsR family transcriptional regulator
MDVAEIEKIAKALADLTRLKIYEQIASKPHICCRELVAMRGVTPATVSHHLKILCKAGLITCRREGQFVMNKANPQVLGEFANSVRALGKKRRFAT